MSERIESFDLSPTLWREISLARVLKAVSFPFDLACIVFRDENICRDCPGLGLFGVALPVSAHADVSCSALCPGGLRRHTGEHDGGDLLITDRPPAGGFVVLADRERLRTELRRQHLRVQRWYNGTGSAMDEDGMQADHVKSGNKSSPQTHVAGGTPQATCGGYNYPC